MLHNRSRRKRLRLQRPKSRGGATNAPLAKFRRSIRHALYRPGRLCILFDVDKSTLTRWRKQGKLPPYTEIAGVKGLTGQQILDFYAQGQRDV